MASRAFDQRGTTRSEDRAKSPTLDPFNYGPNASGQTADTAWLLSLEQSLTSARER